MTDRTEEFQPAGPPSADAPPQAQATTHDADVPPQAQTQTHGADAPPQMQTQTHGAGTQSPLPNRSRRRIMAALHQGSVVFFGVFGAFFLSIYLGLWVSLGVSLLIDSAPLWFLKFIAVPLALEAGLGLGGLCVLYLQGRFVELPLVVTQIGFWLGLHGLDLLMKWLLGQFATAYGDMRVWMLRLPVMAIFFILGHLVFRAALRRHLV